MIRPFILLTVVAGIFSFLCFKQGGVLPGVILAIVAVVPIGLMIASISRRKRNGGQPVPWSPVARKAMAAVGVLLLVGVAYSAYWLFVTPKAEKNLKYDSDLRKACATPRKFFPSAAEFTSGGQNKVAVFYDQGAESSPTQLRNPDAGNPDAKDYSVVVCLTDFQKGAKVGECKFDKGTTPVFTGTFKGHVFEARTGKKLGDISVPANPTADESRDCPTLIYIKGKPEDKQIHTKPDTDALQKALSQYAH